MTTKKPTKTAARLEATKAAFDEIDRACVAMEAERFGPNPSDEIKRAYAKACNEHYYAFRAYDDAKARALAVEKAQDTRRWRADARRVLAPIDAALAADRAKENALSP